MLELKNPSALTRPAALPAEQRSEFEAASRPHLRDYWGNIRKHWWLVTGLTVLVTALVTVYLVRKPNIYEAQALVLVDLEDLNPVQGAASKNPVIVNGATNDPAYFNTQLRILTSQGLLRRMVKTLDLEHNTTFPRPDAMAGRTKWWAALQRALGGNAEKAKTEAKTTDLVPSENPQGDAVEAKRLAPFVKDVSDELRVDPVVERRLGYARDNTRLIEIQYQHPEPEIAAKVVNGIVETFKLLNLERRTETNVTTGDFLQKRIAELQASIRNGEERLMNYARGHQILSLNADQNMVVERLTVLNKQLLEAENKRKIAEASYRAALAPGAASALAEESGGKKIVDIETKLAEFRQHRAQLLIENTEEWPEVKEVTQQIATLENEVRNARNRSTAVLLTNQETQYRQAMATEQSLRKSFEQQRGDTLTQNEAAINYRIIQQEVETSKNLLEGLTQRYKENDVVLAGLRNNIHVIDYAIAPDKPVGPRRWQGIMLAFFFSLGSSVGLALFLEYLNDTIGSSDEAEKMLQLPALVSIPAAAELRHLKFEPERLFTADTHSALAESYRQLRTAVLLSTPGQPPKTLLVTSSLPGEGKTTTAVNLAFCLAQIGARVLIIDADLRRPRLHSIFGMSRQQGLSTCLVNNPNETQILRMVKQYSNTRLHLLTAGPVPPNPAELLGSKQMRNLLSVLEAHFTHIIIDSPPSASFTDSVLLSSLADGILMVIHSGKTQYKTVRHSLNLLASAGAKIFGVILNHADIRHQGHYYEGYYQHAEDQVKGIDNKIIHAEIIPPSEPGGDYTPAYEALTAAQASLNEAPLAAARSGEWAEKEDRFRAICAAFDDPSPQVRDEAARALGQFSANRAEAFARAFHQSPPESAHKIGTAIASSGLAEEAIEQLASGDEKYYEALALLLLMMKAGEARPLLRAINEHENNDVRIAVISLLALSQQKEYTAELRQLAVQASLPAEVQTALLTALHLPFTSSSDNGKGNGYNGANGKHS